MNSTTLHFLLAACLLIVTLFVGLASIKIVRCLDARGAGSHLLLSLLNCLAGGVFLGVCFLDMVPDVSEKYEEFITERGSPLAFAWPQFFICLGFFLVYIVEEACFSVFSRNQKKLSPFEMIKQGKMTTIEEAQSSSSTATIIEENGHGHSHNHHVVPGGDLMKVVTFAVAISFHSLLEGFALGVQNDTSGLVTLFFSLFLHKAVEAFSVGLQVSKGNHSRMTAVVATIIIYSLMSPLGTVIGTLLQTADDIDGVMRSGVILVLEGLACGSFVYVTFFEVLADEKENRSRSYLKLFAVFVGFLLIALMTFVFSEVEESPNPCVAPVVVSTTSASGEL